MIIRAVVNSKIIHWNKNGKFWFSSVEQTMGSWDTELKKFNYETQEEALAQMKNRGYNEEDIKGVKMTFLTRD